MLHVYTIIIITLARNFQPKNSSIVVTRRMKNAIGSESNRIGLKRRAGTRAYIYTHLANGFSHIYYKLLYGIMLVQFDDRMRMKNCYKCCHIVFAAKVNRDSKPFSSFTLPSTCFFLLLLQEWHFLHFFSFFSPCQRCDF